MKIFITSHSSTIGGGISVAQNIISLFGKIGSEHEYFITIPPGLGYEMVCGLIPKHKFLIYSNTNIFKRFYWETFTLPNIIKSYNPDVIFNMANRGVIQYKIPQAIFIQDPHLYYPKTNYGKVSLLERFKFWYHRRHLSKSLKYTDLLFSLTAVAAKRIINSFKINNCIALCPHELLLFTHSSNESLPIPPLLKGLGNKFKLFLLTRYYAHKNIEIVIDLFKKYKSSLQDVVIILTITESEHPNAAMLLRKIKKYNLEENIISVGTLKHEELASYFQYIDALFLPTLLESYSGTYVEAMHYNKPILTSDLDFAEHICKDAALYFNPNNIEDIYKSIIRLINDPILYGKLINEGKKRIQLKSIGWDTIVKNILLELQKIKR